MIPTEVRIGHVHLKVADLERALGFWQGVIGLEVTQRLGNQAAFLSAGGYHHHIALNTWESAGGSPPPARSTGLYHVALLYPTRAALMEALSLKTEMAEGESAAVIGPKRLPASRVASPFRCNRCEPESLVESSTTPTSSLSIPVSRLRRVEEAGNRTGGSG